MKATPLQQLLSNATLFARASITDLRQIGQDVLANVRSVLCSFYIGESSSEHCAHFAPIRREVRGLARAQIRGLIERLVDFTVENLESFISHLNITGDEKLQIINDCAETDHGLPTVGTDPGWRYNIRYAKYTFTEITAKTEL